LHRILLRTGSIPIAVTGTLFREEAGIGKTVPEETNHKTAPIKEGIILTLHSHLTTVMIPHLLLTGTNGMTLLQADLVLEAVIR